MIRPLSFAALGKPFRIIGHRGTRTDADLQKIVPENTLPAFQHAAQQGAGIELDVMLTADGRMVVHHDVQTGKIFQLPGQQKRVRDCTWPELQSATLNVAGHEADIRAMMGADTPYKTPEQYHHVTIPELETALDAVPNTHVHIELKDTTCQPGKLSGKSNQLEANVAQLIKSKNLYDRVTVIGFSPRSLRTIKALDPNIQTGLNIKLPVLLQKCPLFLPWFMNIFVKRWVGADAIQPPYEHTTPAFVNAAHQAGLPLLPWVNQQTRQEEKALFPSLIGMGVDGLITNSVDLLHEALAKSAP